MAQIWDEWSIAKLTTGELRLRTPTARETRVCSDKGWIAKIKGRHPKYRYDRVFCGRRGEFLLPGPGLYEYRNICREGQSNYSYTKYGGDEGFFLVTEDGQLSHVSDDRALEMAAEIAPVTTDSQRTPAPTDR